MDLAQVGASWLHLLATVALIGYYAILGLLVLPAIRGLVPAAALGQSIAAIERRATPIIIGSLAIFLATGIFLMTTDSRYGGVGNLAGSTWATLFLVKHVLVLAMAGVGVYIDALVVRRFGAVEAPGDPAAVRLFVLSCGVMTLLGAVVLFLTAAAQGS
jgi:uncharacterized membrane protein